MVSRNAISDDNFVINKRTSSFAHAMPNITASKRLLIFIIRETTMMLAFSIFGLLRK